MARINWIIINQKNYKEPPDIDFVCNLVEKYDFFNKNNLYNLSNLDDISFNILQNNILNEIQSVNEIKLVIEKEDEWIDVLHPKYHKDDVEIYINLSELIRCKENKG